MTNVNEGSRSVNRAGRKIKGFLSKKDSEGASAAAKTLVHGIQSSQTRAKESAAKDPNFGKKINARKKASEMKKQMPKPDPKLKRELATLNTSTEITRTELMAQLVESAVNYENKYRVDEFTAEGDTVTTHNPDGSTKKVSKVGPKRGMTGAQRVQKARERAMKWNWQKHPEGTRTGQRQEGRNNAAHAGKATTGKQVLKGSAPRKWTSSFRPDSRKGSER